MLPGTSCWWWGPGGPPTRPWTRTPVFSPYCPNVAAARAQPAPSLSRHREWKTSCPQQEPSRSITSCRWGGSCAGQSWGTQDRHPAGWVLPQPHLPPVPLVLPDAAPQPSSSLFFPLPHGPELTSPAYKKQSQCSCPQAWLPLGSHWCPQHGCAGHPAGLP